MTNRLKSEVTVECVRAALKQVKKDWTHDLLRDLSSQLAIILCLIAFLSREQEKISTRKLYDFYSKMNWTEINEEDLSEQRVLDIVNELSTLGLVDTWNVSRGRQGYRKEIKINLNPDNVLQFYEKEDNRQFQIHITQQLRPRLFRPIR